MASDTYYCTCRFGWLDFVLKMIDSYKEAVEFLFGQLPVFERVGASAYKPGL